MIRKIKIHFAFAVLMFTVYIVSNIIYGRSLSDLFYAFLYYLAIAGIVFCINLVRKRKIRWAIFLLALVIPFTYIIFTGTNIKYSSSLEVLELGAKLDVPFLPDLFFQIKDKTILTIVFYLIYFVLPLIYFYSAYYVSKMIFKDKEEIS